MYIHKCNRKIQHKNIVQLIGYCERGIDDRLTIITEFMDQGNLEDLLIKRPNQFTLLQRVDMAKQVCNALHWYEE